MPATNTPLDSLKNAVLRATDGLGGATDAIGGSMCSRDHQDELEWIDRVSNGLWLALAEHVPGITIDERSLVEMTPEAREMVHTYDDGTPVSTQLNAGHYTTRYFPRFDGPYDEFVAEFQRWATVLMAESIAYEAAHPALSDGDDV